MASAGLRKGMRTLARPLPHVALDACGFAGAGSISYGAWLIYVPAGFLVGGALLMALSILFGRRLEARE
ncbi:hypothetical protein [Bradyrhizobium sp. STM 3557]|uniref:hypothetical protein n=1 Tax=Bradyrhizobium sp. STM 3557 TaxID=578920 RepID=UPI00388D4652